jgi:glycerol-3-phosphate cytidylyltransferase
MKLHGSTYFATPNKCNARREGYMYRIGYTTGVFDLFHIGHANILKLSKENCKYLIVGVSTDELVEEYKHRKPIISFSERFEIISSIKYVDEVVTQENLDKILAWEKYNYNVLFHGNDWQNSPMYIETKRSLTEKGVDTMFFPYTITTSSTLLIKTLNKLKGAYHNLDKNHNR